MSIPTIQTRVTGLQVIAPGVCELTIAPLGAPIHFAPGQWLSVHFPIGPRPPLIRAYSLALPESRTGELVLCTDLVPGGLGSSYLHQLEVGSELTVAGPFGNFVLPEPLPEQLLLAARFTGIVPLHCILRELAARHWPVRQIALVYGARTPTALVYHAELAALADSCPGFDYFPITGNGADDDVPEMPAIASALRALRAVAPDATLVPMVSGVKNFVKPVRAELMELGGFERREVRIESYD